MGDTGAELRSEGALAGFDFFLAILGPCHGCLASFVLSSHCDSPTLSPSKVDHIQLLSPWTLSHLHLVANPRRRSRSSPHLSCHCAHSASSERLLPSSRGPSFVSLKSRDRPAIVKAALSHGPSPLGHRLLSVLPTFQYRHQPTATTSHRLSVPRRQCHLLSSPRRR